MKKIISFFLFFSILFTTNSQQIHKRDFTLMGCDFSISVVQKDSALAQNDIQVAVNEMRRIEKLISSWDSASQTSLINKHAGIKPIKVDLELFALIERAINLSQLTDGAFDISYASMDRIWKFDGSMKEFPSEIKIKKSIKKVGFQNIMLDRENLTVFLTKKGMKIGFGAIGKGYAADKAKQLLIKKGVKAGIVNASGDMVCWGKKSENKNWEIAITNPFDKNKAFATLPLNNQAVVTSGNYEKFIKFEGKRYTHIINPKTGYPAEGIVSVTVFAPNTELADALATSIFVLGKEVGMDRINQLPKIECIIIDDKGNITKSKNIEIDKL